MAKDVSLTTFLQVCCAWFYFLNSYFCIVFYEHLAWFCLQLFLCLCGSFSYHYRLSFCVWADRNCILSLVASLTDNFSHCKHTAYLEPLSYAANMQGKLSCGWWCVQVMFQLHDFLWTCFFTCELCVLMQTSLSVAKSLPKCNVNSLLFKVVEHIWC